MSVPMFVPMSVPIFKHMPRVISEFLPQGRAQGKTALLVLTCLLVTCTSSLASAQSENPRTVSVVGEAEERVAPDMATLRMDVIAEDRQASAARRDADEITVRALGLIRAEGIANEDIDSSALSIMPQYRWLKEPRTQELTGYRVSRSIEVRLLDITRLGELLERLSDAGVNRIHSPQPGLLDDQALYKRVLAAAAANARERAEVIAATLGERVGAVQQASIFNATPQPALRFAERAMVMADSAANAPGESYNSGHISYGVSISVTFLLE